MHLVLVILILTFIFISGCVTDYTKSKVTNECIGNLNVLEDKFGINKNSVTVLSSQCSTCSPWYSPQVATFSAIIEKDGDQYYILFTDNCPRHQASQLNYVIESEKRTEIYEKVKEKICADFSNVKIYLERCSENVRNLNSFEDFLSCVNGYSNYISSEIINVNEDWAYCSTEGWKLCEKWNYCGPSGPSQTSFCTEEYCKLSCLVVLSHERIANHFTALCEDWGEKIEGDKYKFSFKFPDYVDEIVSKNYLR